MAATFEALVNFVLGEEWTTHHQSLRAQCHVTAQLLLFSAIIAVTVQLSTTAVDCVADVRGLPTSLVNSLCYNQKLSVADIGAGSTKEWNPQGYYTWSPVYLALLSLLAYLPLKFWNMWENGVETSVARVLNHLEGGTYGQAIRRKADFVRQAMQACERSGYAHAMLFSRFLSYAAFSVAVRWTNHLLGGGFSNLGWDTVSHALGGGSPGEVSPLDGAFPTVGLCSLRLADDNSGASLVSTAICQLNFNHVVGEVHLVLWMLLAAVRYIVNACLFATSLTYHRLGRAALVRKLFGFDDERDVQLVAERLDLGALLFLRQLRLQVYPHIYYGVLEKIAEDLLRHDD